MCGFVREALEDTGLVKKPPSQQPTVVRSDPAADQAKIDQEAAIKTRQDQSATRRRRRFSSLLATGGGGDTSDVVTGQPSAVAGKQTLGA